MSTVSGRRFLSAEPEVPAQNQPVPGIDTEEIIAAVHTRPAPMMPASAGLRL